MPEQNLNQITAKLNAAFEGDGRKLVFWYDDKAEFTEDIDSLELIGAKLHKLEPDNQFYTKYMLERLDTKSNYLIYAPFPKPDIRENHLEDTLRYAKRFFADRASSIIADLGIEEKYKPVINKYIKFFAAKDRTQRFYDLEIESYTSERIEIGLMCVICRTSNVSLEEALSIVLTDDGFEDNKFLAEFEKYDLNPTFWRLCEETFGYSDPKPTLEKLAIRMFVTYAGRTLRDELPKPWQEFRSYKSGNIITFLDSLMNNKLYSKRYDEISAHIASVLNVVSVFEDYPPETLVFCDVFALCDRFIIKWIVERLLDEDVGSKLGGMDIPDVCSERLRKHFGEKYAAQYNMLQAAFHIIGATKYSFPSDAKVLFKQYVAADYQIDSHYRSFYFAYDQLGDTSGYEKLRELVENIYTNKYLSNLVIAWNNAYSASNVPDVPRQMDFFSQYIKYCKDKVVVIISDGLRYEVGRALYEKLSDHEKCDVTTEAILSILPSNTQFGMAALLPNKSITISDNCDVLIDGMQTDTTEKREAILKAHIPNSRCVQYKKIKTMNREQLREIFTGMDVVYIFHNQIDARGGALSTENEVFSACRETIDEIFALIKRLSGSANVQHFIVTGDHGFLYKRDSLCESDKIDNVNIAGASVNRRFIISNEVIEADGVVSAPFSAILGNDDNRILSYPLGANVFKTQGGSLNYVNGGSSPQEMILPVINVKTEKYRVETHSVRIALVSMVNKITNLITSLEFIQSEPVCDAVKATSYKIYFKSEDNEPISNECIYLADKRDSESQKRIFRLRFNFKNKKYDASKRYYLIVYDAKNEVELFRHDVIMDIAFADGIGFE